MSSIITITLNPSVDKSTTVDSLKTEKKLYCSRPVFDPGGGGINVARAITRLGGNAIAVFLCGGHTGQLLESLLNTEGQPFLAVPVAGYTRENLVVTASGGNQYRFVMPGPQIAKNEWERLLEVIRGIRDVSYIVASGGLPEGVPPEIFASFSAIATIKGARFVADTSGEALMEALREGTFMIKPSIGELSAYAGQELTGDGEVIEAAKEIIGKKGAEVVLVSMGASGALLVTAEMTRKISAPVVEAATTVGAGDSLVGGMIYSLSAGKSILEAAEFGVACGTAATLHPGTALCSKEDACRLFREVFVRQPGSAAPACRAYSSSL